jgi:large subunit ribosomal protein L5
VARIQEIYKNQVVAELQKQFSYSNVWQVPKLSKITVNVGVGDAVQNAKILESAQEMLAAITGQKPAVARSKKAIAAFKLRENQPIGVFTTLRRNRMWEFFDRLVSAALPRVKDFRGVNPRGFDGRGNYNLGIREQIVFPEVTVDRLERVRGLNISIVTTANTDDEARELLRHLGMPFRK